MKDRCLFPFDSLLDISIRYNTFMKKKILGLTLTMINFTFRVHSSNLSIQCQCHESRFSYGALQERGRLLNF